LLLHAVSHVLLHRGVVFALSGNEIFDGRVRAAMEAHVGQVVPPPPPNYPELLERVFLPTFVGENEKCK